MSFKPALFAAALAFAMLTGVPGARAHCDGLDGPVATAAQRALDTGNADVTVAFVVGEAQFVRNRTLAAKKSVYTLPKKKKRKA